ncbi:hypothetical protein HUW63_03805 [Myxococcus sp. AM001]|nr:hypothetical protein [Myxococcus sp. AM001]
MPMLTPLESPVDALCWVAPPAENPELTSEDPLALDYVSQQVGLWGLPTLTTRSSRAQAYAMVLYGLQLVERAIEHHSYPATDEVRRELFERWERFWALATLEFREGQLPRGDWDSMRGVRGARNAWRSGASSLPLDFQLISRQQELGNLGAYLAPLRRSGLVIEGSLRPGPGALALIDAFWDEPSENRHWGRYEEYALQALDRKAPRIARTHGRLTLAQVGRFSRLTSLVERERTAQQHRLFEALFVHARDPHSFAMSQLVESAAKAGLSAPRDILDAALAGRLGRLSDELLALLLTARRFGEVMQELVGAFDRVYACLDGAGWVAPRERIGREALDARTLDSLKGACSALLSSPRVGEIRRLPMHGAAFLRLVEALVEADSLAALDLLLAYHSDVQRERRRGEGWIRNEAGRLVLVVTSYTARPEAARFPAFKLDVVRTLLTDLGRLPMNRELDAPEGAA